MKRKRGCAIAVFGLLGVLFLAIGGNLLLGVPLPTATPPMAYYPYIHVPIPGGEAIEYGVWAGHSSWDRASRCCLRWHRRDGVRQYLVWVADTLHVDIRATADYRVIWLVRHGALGADVVGSLDRGTGECLDANAMPVDWRVSLAEQERGPRRRLTTGRDGVTPPGDEGGHDAAAPVPSGDWGFPTCVTPTGGILLAKWPDTWPPAARPEADTGALTVACVKFCKSCVVVSGRRDGLRVFAPASAGARNAFPPDRAGDLPPAPRPAGKFDTTGFITEQTYEESWRGDDGHLGIALQEDPSKGGIDLLAVEESHIVRTKPPATRPGAVRVLNG